MYAIRGNHDDPSYFVGANDLYSNLTLLRDYSYLDINGETWLFVGGAISIDRLAVDFKGRPIRVQGKTWWHDEGFVFDPDKISKKCDVIVTHSAPPWIGPHDKGCINYYAENDPTLWDECNFERKQINSLIELSGARRHYAGHFHISTSAENNGVRSTILNIDELLEHK